MYYLGIKCNNEPYDLNYLDFYFKTFVDLCNFTEMILNNSDYEIIISRCGEENE